MIRWRKQLVDQSAHMAAACLILLPVLAWPCPLSGAISGLGIGLVREITEPDSVFNGGSMLDLLFWTIGGGVAGWFFA